MAGLTDYSMKGFFAPDGELESGEARAGYELDVLAAVSHGAEITEVDSFWCGDAIGWLGLGMKAPGKRRVYLRMLPYRTERSGRYTIELHVYKDRGTE